MRRIALLLLLTAAVLGSVAALRWPAEAIGGSRFIVYMVPPVGDQGDYAHLHCKYHGACGFSSGDGLDWDSWTNSLDFSVWWRSYAWTFSESYVGELWAFVSGDIIDDDDCNYFYANLYDSGINGYKGRVYYYHASGPGSDSFTPTTGPFTSFKYYERELGGMIYDGDCGPGGAWWSGYHVHEKSDSETLTNSRYVGGTYGDYCNPTHDANDNCLKIVNGWSSYFTRRFEW